MARSSLLRKKNALNDRFVQNNDIPLQKFAKDDVLMAQVDAF
jgi:hypothetical protein